MPGPARDESLEEALQKANCLKNNYLTLGYEIIHIPSGEIQDRVNLIEKHLTELA